VLQSSDIPFGVDNMDLVLVDDVLYTGRTIRRGDEWFCLTWGGPSGFSLCVLIDRGHREMPIEGAVLPGVWCRPAIARSSRCGCARSTTKERVVLVDRVDG